MGGDRFVAIWARLIALMVRGSQSNNESTAKMIIHLEDTGLREPVRKCPFALQSVPN